MRAGAVPGHTLARGKYVKDLDHPPVRALADLRGEDSAVEDGRREDQDVPRGHPQVQMLRVGGDGLDVAHMGAVMAARIQLHDGVVKVHEDGEDGRVLRGRAVVHEVAVDGPGVH